MSDKLDSVITEAMSQTESVGDDVTAPVTDTAPEQTDSSSGSDAKPRDESGRFVKSDRQQNESKPKDETPSADITEKADASQKPTEAESKETPAEYGTGRLTKAERALLEGLPSDAQQVVRQVLARQDASFTRKMQEVAESRKGFSAVDHELSTHRARWQSNGVSDAQAVRNMLIVDQALHKDPAATIRWLANYAGVDLANIGVPIASDTANPPPATMPDAVMREIAELKQQLAGFQQSATSQQVAALTAEVAPVLNNHPQADYLPLIEKQIPSFIAAIKEAEPNLPPKEVVARAIDDALWAHPQTRQLMLDAQLSAARGVNASKAQVARSKAVGVTNSGGPVRNGRGNLDSIIADAMDRHL